jgi:hypothetical protein
MPNFSYFLNRCKAPSEQGFGFGKVVYNICGSPMIMEIVRVVFTLIHIQTHILMISTPRFASLEMTLVE